jgi:hypothetical protein
LKNLMIILNERYGNNNYPVLTKIFSQLTGIAPD